MDHFLPESLATERLLLRKPRISDAADIFSKYGQDPDVSKYMVWRPLPALEEAESFVNQAIDAWSQGNRHAYALELSSGSSGLIGMLDARWINSHTIDVGYVLTREFWGQALMPEALAALSEKALSHGSIFRVQATCDIDNAASIRTLEKSGFAREGCIERFVVHPNISSEPRDCYTYARCK